MTLKQVLTEILTQENKDFSDNTTRWKNETIQNKRRALYDRLYILFPSFIPYNLSKPIYDFETFMARFNLPSDSDSISQTENNHTDEAISAEQNSLSTEPTQETQPIDHTEPLSAKYQQELKSLLAMFWFAFLKYCLEGYTDGEDYITSILHDIEEILKKASGHNGKFKDYQERSRRITFFFQKNAYIPELMCLYEHFRTTDDIYAPPTITNMTNAEAILAISKHNTMQELTDHVNTIIEKYQELISECLTDELDQTYFPDIVENPPLNYELSDNEKELIKLIFKILPDDELFAKLREDHWELLSDDHCKDLITCIRKLREDPAVFGRYTGALHIADYETKADEIEEKLLHPYQYRIERKVKQIQHYAEDVCSEAKDRFELLACEQILDDLLAKIPVKPVQKFKSIEKQIEDELKAKEELQKDSAKPE
jgi:hypothetical protein